MTTPNTKLPFGKYKGRRLKECPLDYLHWMSNNLGGTDLHEWAVAASVMAKQIHKDDCGDLEEKADDFLRKHGIDPRRL